MRGLHGFSLMIVVFPRVVCAVEDDPLKVDDYVFTWKMAVIGKTQFLIEKDQKATKAKLRHGISEISMTPEEAAEVGAILGRTEEFFEKLKGSAGKSETIQAGTIHVEFSTSDQGEFQVSVTPDKWIRIFATLTKSQAKDLAGPMKKALRAAALIDKKINF